LVSLVAKADESVATRHSRDWISHDLGRFARWKAGLEERNQDVFVDLWTEIAYEDGELRATIIAADKSEKGRTKTRYEHTDDQQDHHQMPSST
jgi:hypothetical protein